MKNLLYPTMFKKISLLTLLLVALLTPTLATARGASGANLSNSSIIAIVNSDTILKSELDARMRLFYVSTKMEENSENRKQMLKRMIEEKLKLQWTKKFDLEASSEEVAQAFENAAARNNMNKQQLEKFLAANKVPKELFLEHIKANIVWPTYIRERHQSSFQVDDKVIKAKLQEYKSNKSAEQAHLEEIVLFYGDDNRAATEKEAQNLVNEIKRGANFSMIAQQSSHSASAAVGGDIGWVLINKLDNESKKVVAQMQPGQVSIVKKQDSIRIIRLRNKRVGGVANQEEILVTFSQVIMPLPQDPTLANLESLYLQSTAVSKNARSLAGLEKLVRSANKGAIVKVNSDVPASNLNPPQLRDFLMKLPLNKASDPLRVPEGFLILMVEKREKVSSTDPTEDDIYRNLLEERLDQLSKRELKAIRRVAFIEIRE